VFRNIQYWKFNKIKLFIYYKKNPFFSLKRIVWG
jgi:hypothetical protein